MSPAGIDPRSVRRVLLVQHRHLGDVLLCTPAVRALRAALPDATLDFLTEAGGAEVLRGNPYLDSVLVQRPGAAGTLAAVREVRRRRYDVLVDLHGPHPRTQWVVALGGVPRRIAAPSHRARARLYTHFADFRDAPAYEAARKLRFLAPLGVRPGPTPDLSLDLAVGEEDRRFAASAWERLGVRAERPVVALTGVTRDPVKDWGPERWAEVADRLVEAGVQVLLTHGPGEAGQVARIRAAMRREALADPGPVTLRQLAAVFERCALWMGNDGGPKHFAAAVGTRTLSVFRWGYAPEWTDLSAPASHLFVEREPAQGCDRDCRRCAHRGCLLAIAPDDVLEIALEALRRDRSGPLLAR